MVSKKNVKAGIQDISIEIYLQMKIYSLSNYAKCNYVLYFL